MLSPAGVVWAGLREESQDQILLVIEVVVDEEMTLQWCERVVAVCGVLEAAPVDRGEVGHHASAIEHIAMWHAPHWARVA